MRKDIKYFAVAFALSATTIACEKAEMVNIPAADINGSSIGVEISVKTRAIENTVTELETNGFYLYVDQDGDTTSTSGEGDQIAFMKNEGGAWVAYQADGITKATSFNWVDFKNAQVTALYAMENSGEVATLTVADMLSMICSVPADQSVDNVSLYADWLVASSLRGDSVILSETSGKITLDFEHLYSRVAIKVMEDGATLRSAVNVSLVNVPTSATALLAESATLLYAIEGVETGVDMYYDATSTTYQAIVLPSSYDKGIEVAITTVGTTEVYATISDLDQDSDGSQTELLSGQDYEVTVPVPAKFFTQD